MASWFSGDKPLGYISQGLAFLLLISERKLLNHESFPVQDGGLCFSRCFQKPGFYWFGAKNPTCFGLSIWADG